MKSLGRLFFLASIIGSILIVPSGSALAGCHDFNFKQLNYGVNEEPVASQLS